MGINLSIGMNYTSPYAAAGAYAPGQASNAEDTAGIQKTGDMDDTKKAGRKSSPADCQTCKERKYQDGSDEGNVSFKAAAHVSPQAAGAAVRAHEGQHVSNAYKKAAEGNGQVLRASVTIHTSICPECGRSYVSGGVTNTAIKYKNEDNPYQRSLKSADSTLLRGANFDAVA